MGLVKRTPTLQTLTFANYLTLLGLNSCTLHKACVFIVFLFLDLFEQRRTDIKLLKVETVTDSHKI